MDNGLGWGIYPKAMATIWFEREANDIATNDSLCEGSSGYFGGMQMSETILIPDFSNREPNLISTRKRTKLASAVSTIAIISCQRKNIIIWDSWPARNAAKNFRQR